MSEELKAFKQAMRCHHPLATAAEESIAWRMWQSAWSESRRGGEALRSARAHGDRPRGHGLDAHLVEEPVRPRHVDDGVGRAHFVEVDLVDAHAVYRDFPFGVVGEGF